jgi:hypothetical protein
LPQYFAYFLAASQMRRELNARAAKAAKINDPPHLLLARSVPKMLCSLTIRLFKSTRGSHGVHKIVRGMHSFHRLLHRIPIQQIARDNLDSCNKAASEEFRAPGNAPDGAILCLKQLEKPPSNISGGTC